MPAPLNQETVNDTAKLIMHRLIARMLARDSALVGRAKLTLAVMSTRFPDAVFVRDWEDMLARPTSELRGCLGHRDQKMKRLRLSSPFVTTGGIDFTDEGLRRRIRRAAKRLVVRTGRDHAGCVRTTTT